jgi:tryptophan synthase beta chain
MGGIVSELYDQGIIEAQALPQLETFEAALMFARSEGIIPAPEPSHAIAQVIREAQVAKEAGEKRVILFNLSGHGYFDMSAYEQYLNGTLKDYALPQEEIEAAMAELPVL